MTTTASKVQTAKLARWLKWLCRATLWIGVMQIGVTSLINAGVTNYAWFGSSVAVAIAAVAGSSIIESRLDGLALRSQVPPTVLVRSTLALAFAVIAITVLLFTLFAS
jgi:hypothetical protein